MKILVMMILIVLASCGDNDDEGVTCRSLKSSWDSTDALIRTLLLTDLELNTTLGMQAYVWNGSALITCDFDLTSSGTETSGTFTISNDVCEALEGEYTYSKPCNTLTICRVSDNDCSTYN